MKNVSHIRYMTDDDKKELKQILLYDADARVCLNIRGSEETRVMKEGSWDASFVIEYKSKLAGFCVVESLPKSGRNRLSDLYIVKKYRKLGLGDSLLAFALAYAYANWPQRGIDVLTIENEPMESLLQKYQFKNCGVYAKLYYRNGKYLSQTYWYKEY